jgi:hypothetical protein
VVGLQSSQQVSSVHALPSPAASSHGSSVNGVAATQPRVSVQFRAVMGSQRSAPLHEHPSQLLLQKSCLKRR